jgi:hypothetical protein
VLQEVVLHHGVADQLLRAGVNVIIFNTYFFYNIQKRLTGLGSEPWIFRRGSLVPRFISD